MSALCTKARVQRTSSAVDQGCRSGDQSVLIEPMISHQRLAFVTCSFQVRLEAWERKNRVSGKRQFWDRIFKLKMVLGNPNTWLPHCAVNLSFEDQSCIMRIYKDWKGAEFTLSSLVGKAVSSWFLSSLPWSLLPSSLSSSSASNHVCLFCAQWCSWVLTYLIITTTLWNRGYYYLHSSDKETETLPRANVLIIMGHISTRQAGLPAQAVPLSTSEGGNMWYLRHCFHYVNKPILDP